MFRAPARALRNTPKGSLAISSTDATAARTSLRDGGETLVSAASFWFPIRSGVGSGWTEHAPFAFWLVEALRPRRFVELGAYRGYSYAAVCQAVQRLGTGTACHAVDTWQGDDHAGFYGESVFRDLQAFNAQHFSGFSTLVRSTFSEAAQHFADGSVDLLHIDGRHGYDDVKADYEEWVPKLATDAVVLFHDIAVRERGFGVARFWEEISPGRPHFAFLHGNGLGVLGSAEVRSPRLRALFDATADADAADAVRGCYARLGGGLADRYDVAELRAGEATRASRIEALETEKAAFAGGCADRDGIIVKLQHDLTEANREKGAFAGGCAERDGIIAELRSQIAALSRPEPADEAGRAAALTAALRDQIAIQDEEMARLIAAGAARRASE